MKPILVINDDVSLLTEITLRLKNGGYFYLSASNAKEALTLASGYDFALVILDLKLPDMDGDELYQRLLKSEEHYTLPVVALVDSLDADEVSVVNRLLPQGVVTLLSKPVKGEWLDDLFARYGERRASNG
ncbi:response regulator [Luteolibacter pohnpeiensis]|uniref:Response regulator n=1 Tax=Luteolibacter pohnpeiensis TaxID=454153 RepID=A0A934VSM7_9BACT|nr:response regulator [Luteolibacter pohnpeiensis]MBK1884481.1 response regulator [Luteolibacter pohnpeiensis]